MRELEERVAALEEAVFGRPSAGAAVSDRNVTDAPESDHLWILRGLQERHPDGVVALAGHLPGPGGVAWQSGRPSDFLVDADWMDRAAAFEALGNPVRLRLLQLIFTGTTSTHDLAEAPDLGTTGQLHHHLRALKAAGWIVTARRGEYTVAPARVIPLLVCLLAVAP